MNAADSKHPPRGGAAPTGSPGAPSTAAARRAALHRWTTPLLLCAALAWGRGVAGAAEARQQAAERLANLSIEDLMNIDVTSVARKEQKASDAAAAVFVLTQEDLRRSGATTFAEALRTVPGLEVARLDAHDWAVSARGFNGLFANKLLVMMDGRSVYTPLFSGVFWDAQNTLFEDVDRIEVIRGPGATVWGANAVNGVINIITKSAAATQGLLLTGGGGTEERVFGGLRYGGQLGPSAYYRVYSQYEQHADSLLPSGERAFDHAEIVRGGLRLDWEPSRENQFTFQGDVYSGAEAQTFTYPLLVSPYAVTVSDVGGLAGGNVMGRLTHTFSSTADLQVQLYYDRTVRGVQIFNESRNTFDFDAHHHFAFGERQDVVWGVGYRYSGDRIGNTPVVSFTPAERDTHLYSLFAQDEIALVKERVFLTLGSKFEHNDFTGFEVQPSVRLLWKLHPHHTLWASVSRAVRTPSRAEDDVRISQAVLPPGAPPSGAPLPTQIAVLGNRSVESEKLIAYELGYRAQVGRKLSLDVATFYNHYTELNSLEPRAPGLEPAPAPHVLLPVVVDNKFAGATYGVELASTWQAADWWRLQAAYTWLHMHLRPAPDSGDGSVGAAERSNPQHQFALRSLMDLTPRWQLDATLRYVDAVPAQGGDAYVTADVRIGWRPTPNWEVSVVGQNLLDNQHPEFTSNLIDTRPTEVPRGVYGKITWRY